MDDGGGWVQWVLGVVTAAFGAMAGHLYIIGSSGRLRLHERLERLNLQMNENYVRKEVMKEGMDTLAKALVETRKEFREETRMLNEKMDDVSRDMNILIGKFDQQFNVHTNK